MKKALFAAMSALLFASCNFWNEPVKEFFEYWASEAYISGWDARSVKQNDSAGVTSIPSGADAEVLLKAQNPKGFRFVMPAPGSHEMITFSALGAQPVPGTDYTLTQVSADTLKLVYKAAFLQAHEWGNGDLGAVITLHADDGRKFSKAYGFNLKANTPPPAPTFILAKTATLPEQYVLCLKVAASDMALTVNGEMLHKDIAKISIGGAEYPLTVNASHTDFNTPSDSHFIGFTDAAQLTTPPQPPVPSGQWILYYNTGIAVGSAYQEYPVQLIDEKGLVSPTLSAGTATNEPPPENITVTAGEQGTGSGNFDTDPAVIQGAAGAPEGQLTISNVAGTVVHCTVTDMSTMTSAQYDGNFVTVPLPLNGEHKKLYKVEYYTDGAGYKPSAVKTKYYKVGKTCTVTFRVDGQGGSLTGTYNGNSQTASGVTARTVRAAYGETVTFSAAETSTDYAVHSWTGLTASPPTGATATLTVTADTLVSVKFYETTLNGGGSDSWKKLKELVAAAPSGGTLKISGMIQSTTASGNNGELVIDKDLTIEAQSGTATLDANESAFSTKEAKHRVFRVKDGKTLTLKNVTLKNGYAGNAAVGESGTQGGGIRLENGAKLSLSGVTISGCKARTDTPWHGNGAGIYVVSGAVVMEDTTLSANDANAYGGAVYLNGGTLTMKGSTVITPSTGATANRTGENDVHLSNGAKIIVDGALTGTAPVARITPRPYAASTRVLDGAEVGSNYTKFTVTDQDFVYNDGVNPHVRKWEITSSGYLQGEGVTIDASKPRAWLALKKAVKAASDGDVITISGTVQATNVGTGTEANYGEIEIDKNLTIQGKTGANTDMLDANESAFSDVRDKHRVFKITGGTLSLKKLTLKNGAAENAASGALNASGGGILLESGGVSLSEVTVSGCKAKTTAANKGNGGGIYAAAGTTVNLDIQTTIQNCKAEDGGAIYNDGGSLTIQGAIKGSEAANNGGAIYAKGGTVTLNNATIGGTSTADANKAKNGGGVYLTGSGARGTMTGGKVSYNEASTSGGGVYNEGGAFEISGGEIKSNKAKYGGGIYVKGAGATLTMNGGSISENKAVVDGTNGGDGGGVYIYDAAFTLVSGSVSNNTAAKDAGGVRVFGGEFTMEGGAIELNTVTGTSSVHNSGRGGGVDIVAATMNMKGGEIKNNTAKNGGGGVSLGLSGASNSVLNMSGGTISGNTLTESAGTGKGVEFFVGSTTHDKTYYTIMKMSGSAKVDTNNDVYLTNKDDHSNEIRMITVDGELTGTAPVAQITPKTYAAGMQVLDGNNVSTEHSKFRVTPDGSEHWIVGSSGTLLNFDAISADEIKAVESSMKSDLITNRENLVNKLLFYKTSDGSYGVMVITAVDNTTPGSITFNYKTFNSDGTIKKSDNNHQEAGTNVFDLDSASSESTAGDFWLQNSSTQNFQPRNGAKFYVLP